MAVIRRVTVIVNPSSGPKREGAAVDTVRAALTAAGVADIEVITLGDGLDLKRAIGDAISHGADAVIAAGGDGTISAVSSALVETETPLGVLPTGTLNHFAKDLGIPDQMEGAARIIAAGNSICVDAAKVNGRVFVNNSSIGLYPASVGVRESLMRKGWPKRIAAPAGIVAAMREFRDTSVRLTTEEGGLVTRTPFVFVGNNMYELSGLDAGTRTRLQDGVLQVCTVRNPSRFALLRTVLLAIAFHTDAAPELHIVSAKQAHIETPRKRVRVAVDGEVIFMESPLIYSICPGALRVLAPARSEDA